MAFGWCVPQCTYFDDGDVTRIVDSALRLFERFRWTIDGTGEFMDRLRAFGCEIQGTKVTFPKRVIDETMARIEAHKAETLKRQPPAGRPAAKSVAYAISGQGLYFCETATDRVRLATKKDQADLSRVANAYEGLDRYHPTIIPQDAPLMTRDLHALVTIMLHSDKPYKVSAFSPQIIDYFLEASTIYYGSRQEGIEKLPIPALVYVNTPFTISREPIEAAMKMRGLNKKPLTYYSMPVLGAMCPVTYPEALALITAEVLGVNAVSLAIDDCPCGWISDPVGFDFKTTRDLMIGPEVLLSRTAQTHIASRLFGEEISVGLPIYTSATVPGAQSMAERGLALAVNFMAGIRDFGRGLGTLANADVGSILQLVLDMEMIEFIKATAGGFDVDPGEIDEDFIVETANQGACFLETEHTARNFRQCAWFPDLMDRRQTPSWIKEPATMLENARKKALHLQATAPNKCPLDEAKRRELDQLLVTADKELG